MTRPTEPEITWTLSMTQANVVLSIIGKQPFEQIADLIIELRNQAQQQLQAFQQQNPMMPGEHKPGNGDARAT